MASSRYLANFGIVPKKLLAVRSLTVSLFSLNITWTCFSTYCFF